MAKTKIKIAVAADHGGYMLKDDLIEYLNSKGYSVEDFGAFTIEASDYPLYGQKAARAVAAGAADFGILICKTGFGMAITANKIKGIRSAVCDSADEAVSARQHNHCNVLSLAAQRIDAKNAKSITEAFLTTSEEAGRHQRRVDQITKLEKKN